MLLTKNSIPIEGLQLRYRIVSLKATIVIYNQFSSTSGPVGQIEIPANTGGRIRIGVLVPLDDRKHEVVLVDRNATTQIDLDQQLIQPDPINWQDPSLKPLGWISGESLPVKFVPCAVWSAMPPQEQRQILGDSSEFANFCNERPEPPVK